MLSGVISTAVVGLKQMSQGFADASATRRECQTLAKAMTTLLIVDVHNQYGKRKVRQMRGRRRHSPLPNQIWRYTASMDLPLPSLPHTSALQSFTSVRPSDRVLVVNIRYRKPRGHMYKIC